MYIWLHSKIFVFMLYTREFPNVRALYVSLFRTADLECASIIRSSINCSSGRTFQQKVFFERWPRKSCVVSTRAPTRLDRNVLNPRHFYFWIMKRIRRPFEPALYLVRCGYVVIPYSEISQWLEMKLFFFLRFSSLYVELGRQR